MIKRDEYFMLYANCIPVKGAKRSIICDLQRNRYKFIPNLLFEILTKYKNTYVHKVKEAYNFFYDKEIDTFFQLLIDEEWGMFTNEPEVFPEMSLKWDFPGIISNAIIDIDKNSNHDYKAIIDQLNGLGCTALQIRFFHQIEQDHLNEILNKTLKSNLTYIEIYFKYKNKLVIKKIKDLLTEHARLRVIYIYGANENKLIELESNHGGIVFIKELISQVSHCGHVNSNYFQVNIPLFTESKEFNSCLNRKITIDCNGQVKNCPYTKETYGYFNQTSLSEIVNRIDFQKYWKINKDQIEICKDCEFRYICTDCRAFLKNKNNVYSKPFYCSYDPYTAIWKD